MKRILILCLCVLLSGCYNIETNNTNDKETTTTKKETTITTTTKEKSEFIGLYKDTVKDGSIPSEIEFKENNEFAMALNLCEGMAYINGTYQIKNKTIILNFDAGQFKGFTGDDLTTLKFEILNDKKIKFVSETVCCGPYKNASFAKKDSN